VDRQGAVKFLTAPAREYETPRVSPDGQQVVVVIGGDIWIYDIYRGILTRLTVRARSWSPFLTPDAKRVTFSSGSGGTAQLRSKPANGSGPEEMLTHSERTIDASSSSPDGQVLPL
jgi:Tol biopolymer transport system component